MDKLVLGIIGAKRDAFECAAWNIPRVSEPVLMLFKGLRVTSSSFYSEKVKNE